MLGDLVISKTLPVFLGLSVKYHVYLTWSPLTLKLNVFFILRVISEEVGKSVLIIGGSNLTFNLTLVVNVSLLSSVITAHLRYLPFRSETGVILISGLVVVL